MGIILLFRGVYETVYTHLENKIRNIYICLIKYIHKRWTSPSLSFIKDNETTRQKNKNVI